jgi:thiamine biosynthesis protein ThiS
MKADAERASLQHSHAPATINMMKLIINGAEREFANVTTLSSLVEQLGMKPDRVAIERNRDIVPRDRWPETTLQDGDRLEIVHFVGGGRDRVFTTEDTEEHRGKKLLYHKGHEGSRR